MGAHWRQDREHNPVGWCLKRHRRLVCVNFPDLFSTPDLIANPTVPNDKRGAVDRLSEARQNDG
jgi:hypothetical protein